MSIHEKVLILNLTKNKDDLLLPVIPNVEPEPYMLGGRIKWKNRKLNNNKAIKQEDISKICEAISGNRLRIETPADLANILFVPTGHLLHILYHQKNKYTQFEIKKRNGTTRKISAPNNSISILQERLKIILDHFYRPKKCAHGFIREKSIISNADKHKKKKFVVNIDLDSYFDTITFPRIYGVFKNRPFNFSHATASIAAQLCTHEGKLPQGASTSPVLANIVSASLDKQLTQLAKKNNITYTRYADDITFSFDRYPMEEVIKSEDNQISYELGTHLNNIIEGNGFRVNPTKFRVQKKDERQVVTGLVVNDKVNLQRSYIRTTRAMIHGWCTNKIAASVNYIKSKNITCNDPNKYVSIFRNHIYGRLSFIKMVRGDDFPPYLKMYAFMASNDNKPTKEGLRTMQEIEMFDVFLCHASEDKVDIVIPLHEELTKRGINAFIDTKYIEWGDSLTEKINGALAKSKYVIAILSCNSVDKKWPLKELNSVLAREIAEGDKKLLTLVKQGDEEVISAKLPLLADKLYAVYKGDPVVIANNLEKLLRG